MLTLWDTDSRTILQVPATLTSFFFVSLLIGRLKDSEFTTGVANLCLKNEVLETCCTRLYTHASAISLLPIGTLSGGPTNRQKSSTRQFKREAMIILFTDTKTAAARGLALRPNEWNRLRAISWATTFDAPFGFRWACCVTLRAIEIGLLYKSMQMAVKKGSCVLWVSTCFCCLK